MKESRAVPTQTLLSFPASLIHQTIAQKDTKEREERPNPQPTTSMIEDAPIFAYHKVTFSNLTIQAPWSNVTFRNVTGVEVEDTPEVQLGENFCTAIGLDFSKYLSSERQCLHDMDVSQVETPAPVPGLLPARCGI